MFSGRLHTTHTVVDSTCGRRHTVSYFFKLLIQDLDAKMALNQSKEKWIQNQQEAAVISGLLMELCVFSGLHPGVTQPAVIDGGWDNKSLVKQPNQNSAFFFSHLPGLCLGVLPHCGTASINQAENRQNKVSAMRYTEKFG